MASTVLKEYRKYFTPLQSPWVSPLTANSSYFCSLCVPFSSLFLGADPFQFSVVWASSFQLSQFCLQPMFSMQFWQAYSSRHWLFLFKLFILCPFLRLFFFFLQTTVSGLWLLLVMISFSPTVKPLKLVTPTLRSNFI